MDIDYRIWFHVDGIKNAMKYKDSDHFFDQIDNDDKKFLFDIRTKRKHNIIQNDIYISESGVCSLILYARSNNTNTNHLDKFVSFFCHIIPTISQYDRNLIQMKHNKIITQKQKQLQLLKIKHINLLTKQPCN